MNFYTDRCTRLFRPKSPPLLSPNLNDLLIVLIRNAIHSIKRAFDHVVDVRLLRMNRWSGPLKHRAVLPCTVMRLRTRKEERQRQPNGPL